jgi:hypothetical protein
MPVTAVTSRLSVRPLSPRAASRTPSRARWPPFPVHRVPSASAMSWFKATTRHSGHPRRELAAVPAGARTHPPRVGLARLLGASYRPPPPPHHPATGRASTRHCEELAAGGARRMRPRAVTATSLGYTAEHSGCDTRGRGADGGRSCCRRPWFSAQEIASSSPSNVSELDIRVSVSPGSVAQFVSHCRSQRFTGDCGPPVHAGQERWRTLVNAQAQSSKACEGAILPWVQILPPPPLTCTNAGLSSRQTGASCPPGLTYWSQLRAACGPLAGISCGCYAWSRVPLNSPGRP